VLKGGLGGLLAGGAAGTVLSGGLNDLLKQLQQGGLGDAANSWVGTGPNRPVSPADLGSALGADQIQSLTSQFGLSREELLDGLSQHLPEVVDHLTPGGQVPSPQEMHYMHGMLPPASPWFAFGIALHQFPMVAQAELLGGHVRVGLEDNIYLGKGQLAPSNAALVEKAARIIDSDADGGPQDAGGLTGRAM
jgi:uncharacterized protein YidB (DUF937 family)